MKKVILAILLIVSFSSSAQIGGEDEVYLKGERIDPTYNGGGLDKFYDYLNKEFDFSKPTKEGAMITSFTISETGEIKNIKVVQFVDIESATEMIRVLKKAPKWKPATRNGKEISVDMKFPFELVRNKQEKTKETSNQQTNSNKNSVYTAASVEEKPEYPGGIQAFYKFVGKNYKLPDDKNFKGGKVIVSFVIEKDGSLTDFKILEDAGFSSGDEAISMLKKCKNWIPAKQKGIPVRCSFTLPITLQSN